jgi:hypothetical protein
LQHQGAQQLLGWDRFAAKRAIESVEVGVHAGKTAIEHLAYTAQRVIGWNIPIQPAHREQFFLHHIGSTHLAIPLSRLHSSFH